MSLASDTTLKATLSDKNNGVRRIASKGWLVYEPEVKVLKSNTIVYRARIEVLNGSIRCIYIMYVYISDAM
jgi:hypothetical protein